MGNQLYKQRHREKGLCVDCSKKTLPGRTRCFKHTIAHQLWKEDPAKNIARSKKWKEYWEKHNLCLGCGRPRDDEKSSYCMNCRSNVFRPRWAYWYELEARGIKFDRN